MNGYLEKSKTYEFHPLDFPTWSNNGTIITVVAVARKSKDFFATEPTVLLRGCKNRKCSKHVDIGATQRFMISLVGGDCGS